MGYTLFPSATSVKNGFFENIANGSVQAWTVDWKPGVYEVIPNSTTATYTMVLKTGGKNGTTVLTGTIANGGSTFTTNQKIDYVSFTGTNAASALTGIAVRYLTNIQIYIPGTGFVTRYTSSTVNTLDGSAYLLLVGGGSGGQCGSPNGGQYPSAQAGAGGASGYVYSVGPVTLLGNEVVTIGTAGTANSTALQAGNAGNHTTFGNYSSASGSQAGGGGGASNNNSPRTGGGGGTSNKTNAPTILTNSLLSANSTTGGGGGGTWNFAVGESAGAGGGSGIGTGGTGGNTGAAQAPSGTGFGAGGGGGAGAGNGVGYVPRGGDGSPGVAYVIMA